MPRPKLDIEKDHLSITIDPALKMWLVGFSNEKKIPKSEIISDLLYKFQKDYRKELKNETPSKNII